MMGRNIRFLKSDLEPFRATVQTGGGNWQDRVNMMALYINANDGKILVDALPGPGR